MCGLVKWRRAICFTGKWPSPVEDALICFFSPLDLELLAASLTLHDRAFLARAIAAWPCGDIYNIAPLFQLILSEHIRLEVFNGDLQCLEFLAILLALRDLAFCANRRMIDVVGGWSPLDRCYGRYYRLRMLIPVL